MKGGERMAGVDDECVYSAVYQSLVGFTCQVSLMLARVTCQSLVLWQSHWLIMVVQRVLVGRAGNWQYRSSNPRQQVVVNVVVSRLGESNRLAPRDGHQWVYIGELIDMDCCC